MDHTTYTLDTNEFVTTIIEQQIDICRIHQKQFPLVNEKIKAVFKMQCSYFPSYHLRRCPFHLHSLRPCRNYGHLLKDNKNKAFISNDHLLYSYKQTITHSSTCTTSSLPRVGLGWFINSPSADTFNQCQNKAWATWEAALASWGGGGERRRRNLLSYLCRIRHYWGNQCITAAWHTISPWHLLPGHVILDNLIGHLNVLLKRHHLHSLYF